MKAWQSYGSILTLAVSLSLTSACEVSHRYDTAPAAGKGGGSAGNGGKGGSAGKAGSGGKGSAGKDDADAGL